MRCRFPNLINAYHMVFVDVWIAAGRCGGRADCAGGEAPRVWGRGCHLRAGVACGSPIMFWALESLFHLGRGVLQATEMCRERGDVLRKCWE